MPTRTWSRGGGRPGSGRPDPGRVGRRQRPSPGRLQFDNGTSSLSRRRGCCRLLALETEDPLSRTALRPVIRLGPAHEPGLLRGADLRSLDAGTGARTGRGRARSGLPGSLARQAGLSDPRPERRSVLVRPARDAETVETCNDALSASLRSTLAALSERFGDDPARWRWGSVQAWPASSTRFSATCRCWARWSISKSRPDGGDETVNRGRPPAARAGRVSACPRSGLSRRL